MIEALGTLAVAVLAGFDRRAGGIEHPPRLAIVTNRIHFRGGQPSVDDGQPSVQLTGGQQQHD